MATTFSKRIIAYLIDFFVISALMWIVSYFLFAILGPSNVYSVYQYLPYVVAVLVFVYFVVFEKVAGATLGKALMNLQVKSRNGANITWPQAIVRNLSKIYWFPVIFDWLIGRFLRTDRLLNNITRTVVVKDY
jgi:uncharacterized RDD family membrane protein YckC